MTNKEIAEAVEAVIDGEWHEFSEGDMNYDEHVDEKKLRRLLEEKMCALVAQAYEEAAKASCALCKRGVPLQKTARKDGIRLRHKRSEHAGEVRCAAPSIRALRDSLVETVEV